MSLLEDIFLQDEADEAQELERVIEGDEYDEHPRSPDDESDGGNREDEAEEDKRRVDPTSTKPKKVSKNPRFILNPARLTGPRGIQVIPEHFKDFKFKGKGHEKEDLDLVLKKLEHWAYRLYPKFEFKDCLKKIETLGKKRPVMVHLHKIRTDQFISEETVVQKDSSDDEAQPPQEEDEFDKLLQQQIDLARSTPAPGSTKKGLQRSDQWERVMSTPVHDDRSLTMPKATSSPSISDEQKERMLRNRKLAEERRLARLKQPTNINSNPTNNTIIEIDENEPNSTNVSYTADTNENNKLNKKNNRSNVIDSSDSEEEYNIATVNESIIVDVHNTLDVDKEYDKKTDKKNNYHEDEMSIDDVSTKKTGSQIAGEITEENNEQNNANTIEDDQQTNVINKNDSVNAEENEMIDVNKKARLSNHAGSLTVEVNDKQILYNTDGSNKDPDDIMLVDNNFKGKNIKNRDDSKETQVNIEQNADKSESNSVQSGQITKKNDPNEDKNELNADKSERNLENIDKNEDTNQNSAKQVVADTDVMDVDFSDDF